MGSHSYFLFNVENRENSCIILSLSLYTLSFTVNNTLLISLPFLPSYPSPLSLFFFFVSPKMSKHRDPPWSCDESYIILFYAITITFRSFLKLSRLSYNVFRTRGFTVQTKSGLM